jgi:hypothetical protein
MKQNALRWLAPSRVATLIAAGLLATGAVHALDRPADPVVLTGADIPALAGIAPSDLVAFKHDGTWQQIPVQVDERTVVDFTNSYNGRATYGSISRLDYTDSGTFTGPDPDATLDADDEIVFMAVDAADACFAFSEPAGIVADSGIEVTITDPLGGAPGYVYLFQQDGSLDPAAGQQYVTYTFNLLSGDYLTTYSINSGPNPENTTLTTPYYERHFSDRWKCDLLRIFDGTATGVDILDRHKNLFGPGICGRSEDTFSAGEGCFITNKAGPVRAIRNYLGANSGPRTQRRHIYYRRREDLQTFLRVHDISGVMNFFDYSPGAAGMTYYSDVDSAGVTIDGVPDSVTQGAIRWELVEGPQGSLVMTADLYTDIPDPSYTSYYLDDTSPPDTQCTGDAFAYGSSGFWMNHAIPNTDPASAPCYDFEAHHVFYYDAPGLTVADAQERRAFVDNPLQTSFTPWTSAGTGLPVAGIAALVALATALWAFAKRALSRK